MSHPFVQYILPALLQSRILTNVPDSIPTTDELEEVEAELRALRPKSVERAKKAEADMKALEAGFKKMKEKEKGKAKATAVTKVKREPSYTPSLGPDDRSYSPAPSSTKVGSSSKSVPTVAAFSPAPKAPPEARKVKKKEKDKKRKRDLDDSDNEHELARPRKLSQPPATQLTHKDPPQYKPSKLNNSYTNKAPSGPSWEVPPPKDLLPARPSTPEPAPAGPSKPTDVTEDFSKLKAPAQVPVNTFYASIEPWLRNIREEDVGWLEYSADEVEPYAVPKLGRHYTEVWEDEEVAIYGGVPAQLDFVSRRNPNNSFTASNNPLPKWDPSTMTESDLTSDKGHGPVTERLVAALLPTPDLAGWKAIEEAEDARDAVSGPSTSSPSKGKDKITVAELEERIRDTARFHGLLEGEPDFSQIQDDAISTALRQCQRELRQVVATNKVRKARLVDIARDRLAYQEYVEARESIDKNILSTFSKLQKKEGPKSGKRKKKGDSGSVNGHNAGPPPPHPASTGLGPDDDGKLVVPDNLKSLVETRRGFVDLVGGFLEEKQKEAPGRCWGVPKESVFQGIDEEVKEMLSSERARGRGIKRKRTESGHSDEKDEMEEVVFG